MTYLSRSLWLFVALCPIFRHALLLPAPPSITPEQTSSINNQLWFDFSEGDKASLMLAGTPLWSAKCSGSVLPPAILDRNTALAVVSDDARNALRVVRLSPNESADCDLIPRSPPGFGATPVIPPSPVPLALFPLSKHHAILWLGNSPAASGCLCEEMRVYDSAGALLKSRRIVYSDERYLRSMRLLRVPLPQHGRMVSVDAIVEKPESGYSLWITTTILESGLQLPTKRVSIPVAWLISARDLEEKYSEAFGKLPDKVLGMFHFDHQSVQINFDPEFDHSPIDLLENVKANDALPAPP